MAKRPTLLGNGAEDAASIMKGLLEGWQKASQSAKPQPFLLPGVANDNDWVGDSADVTPTLSGDCQHEWAQARIRCAIYFGDGLLGRFSGYGATLDQCIRGQVSARCGGSPIDLPGKRRNPRE